MLAIIYRCLFARLERKKEREWHTPSYDREDLCVGIFIDLGPLRTLHSV